MFPRSFLKIFLFGILISFANCQAEEIKQSVPKGQLSNLNQNKRIAKYDYIVGTDREFLASEWKLLLNHFGEYEIELFIKSKPTYRLKFKVDPGLEALTMELKQNPGVRYVERNALLEKKPEL